MLFDIHGDIWTDVTIKRLKGKRSIIKNDHLERFRKGNMVGGIFVVWIDPPHDKNPKDRLIQNLVAMNSEIYENRDVLKVVYNTSEFYKAINEERLAVLLGMEGLSSIGDNVEALYTLYQLGFRHASLTWNEQNALGTGVKGDVNRGLTEKGKEAIKIINNLGIILDVSHANEKTFWDIYNITDKPFIASHSNAKALCDVPRNLSDDQIIAIGDKDGLIGINAHNYFVNLDYNISNVDHFINHLEHVINLIGINRVALGFDFFEYLEGDTGGTFLNDPYKGTIGLEDISKTNNLLSKLESRGFSNEDIEKICFKNFINLMDRILI